MKERILSIVEIIIILGLILFLVKTHYDDQSAYNILSTEKEKIETAYKKDVENLHKKISEKERLMVESGKKILALKKQLNSAEKKIKEIKKPVSPVETAQRMNALHYPTVLTALKDVICFPDDEAANMVVAMEECQVIKEENGILKQVNMELEKQINNLNEVVEIKTEEVAKCEEMAANQEAVCEERIEAAEPSLLDTIIKAAGLLGAGFLICALLL